MSNMKDYMMWLNDNGIATWDTIIGELRIPTGINIYANDLLIRYKNDAKWHDIDDEEDILEDEDENDKDILEEDDNDLGDNTELLVDCSWTPEEHWITPNGGITADASVYLHELDSKGELI